MSPFGNQGIQYGSDLAKKTDKENRQSSLKTIMNKGLQMSQALDGGGTAPWKGGEHGFCGTLHRLGMRTVKFLGIFQVC